MVSAGCGGGGASSSPTPVSSQTNTSPAGNQSNPQVVTDRTATLTWDAPTMRMDGSPATVAGYIIYYGTSSGQYAYNQDVPTSSCQNVNGVTQCSYTLTNLSPGAWYFTVIAYDSSGYQSGDSNQVSKTI